MWLLWLLGPVRAGCWSAGPSGRSSGEQRASSGASSSCLALQGLVDVFVAGKILGTTGGAQDAGLGC